MIRIAAFMSLLALVACGADGEPVQPVASATVSSGVGGVRGHATVGFFKGPVTVQVNL